MSEEEVLDFINKRCSVDEDSEAWKKQDVLAMVKALLVEITRKEKQITDLKQLYYGLSMMLNDETEVKVEVEVGIEKLCVHLIRNYK